MLMIGMAFDVLLGEVLGEGSLSSVNIMFAAASARSAFSILDIP
jgi:hypothetical protein